ncbi:MAG: hypothetical protein ACPG4Q_08535 [Phycisphaeraceae bacterium]
MSRIRRKIAQFTTAALLGLALASPASALFAPAPSVPTDRLITNISAYIEENPEEAQGYYLLARVHYMAFVNRLDHVRSNDPGSAKKLPRLVDPRQYGKAEGEKINEEKAIEHAQAALQLFGKAMELDKDNALYHLGLASFYEQSSPLAKKIAPNPKYAPAAPGVEQPKVIPESERFIKQAVASYLKAYLLDREAALAKDSVFLPFYPVAYEAGKAYLRLTEAHDIETDKEQVAQINADLKAIDSKPKAITPIIFRIEGNAPTSLGDLIADETIVKFDLDADGIAERRPWVNPDTAILVWDPDKTGKITSGEQLFGNMTFRMLFSDGYRALDSLDNNRDGKLADKELAGLALWHDRNSNGVSDPGEVTPIDQTPIRAIATDTTDKVNGLHPMNGTGLILNNGQTRPTWDWVIPAAQ